MASSTRTCATPPRFRLDMEGGMSIPILPLGLVRKLTGTGNLIRICPGRHYAASVLFMVAATVLHTLSITAPLGKDGKPTRLEGKMSYGLLSCVADPVLRRCRHVHLRGLTGTRNSSNALSSRDRRRWRRSSGRAVATCQGTMSRRLAGELSPFDSRLLRYLMTHAIDLEDCYVHIWTLILPYWQIG